MTRLEAEAFLAIIQYGSITAAAEKLYVTQPALSRRIRAMEQELGYDLLVRGKGIRSVCLTQQGQAFVPVAERFCKLYRQAEAIAKDNQKPLLNLASVGSVSTCVLPPVLHNFLALKKYNLCFHNYLSFEAYRRIENGMADLALISNHRYAKDVITLPAFREPFVLLCGANCKVGKAPTPTQLNPANEVRLPWSPEYDIWHERWFDAAIEPNVTLDHMPLLKDFLTGENWAVVPLTVARRMENSQIFSYPLRQGPEDRIIYYLVPQRPKEGPIHDFLKLLHQELLLFDGVESFLAKGLTE
ncbi:MAG: LysR family transcriptional regulator [Pygmaiobacter sp.]|nr:LysR family transcriptional regulator [Pygmaiobacter sp.]